MPSTQCGLRGQRAQWPFRSLVAAGLLLVAVVCRTATPQQGVAEPLTVAERSQFQATSRSAEVVEFLRALDRRADHLQTLEFGRTFEGRPLECVVVASPPVATAGELTNDPRAVVLVLGNIHAGECAGKEAMLMLLRGLAGRQDHPWLRELVLLFVPNFNADGNDMVSKDNRPGQIGPSAGMGQRANAQGLDLNRDYMKLDSPECRALVGLLNQWDPHVFIDLHTTNGSWHRYALTYDVPHHPASPAPLREFLRNQMMPAITASLEKQGLATFYYGNFDRHHTRWSTFGDSPRFGTEYVGVRGRMTILSEAYAYISYEARIVASREFLGQCLDYVAAQREPITRLLKDVRRESSRPTSGEVALRTTVTPLPDKVVVRGYKPAAPPRASHPAPTEPHDYTVDFYTRYEPTLTAARPQAYLVPAAQTGITDRLKWHGIRFDVLRQDETRDVEAYQIISLSRSEQAYQNRHLLQVEVAARRQRRRIPAGTLRVPTAQPLGNLVMLLLEPAASDSLATWNVIQPELQPDEEYPVWRISER